MQSDANYGLFKEAYGIPSTKQQTTLLFLRQFFEDSATVLRLNSGIVAELSQNYRKSTEEGTSEVRTRAKRSMMHT